MKNLLIAAMALFMIGNTAFAVNNSDNYLTNLKNQDLKLALNLGDVTNLSKAEINLRIQDFFSKTLSNYENETLDCEVTVTATIDIGVGSVEVSVTVSGPCNEVIANGSAIANNIINQITKIIKDKFK